MFDATDAADDLMVVGQALSGFDAVSAFDPDSMPECPDWTVDDVLAGRVATAEVLADCVSGRPGAGRVQMLSGLDREALTYDQCCDYLRALELQQRWLQAEQLRTLAAIAERDPSAQNWSQESVAVAMNLSPSHAGSVLVEATALVSELPATTTALAEGRISVRHARAISESSQSIETELRGPLEQAVLSRAESQTVPELRRSLTRACLRLDADVVERRRAKAQEGRRIQRWAIADGMAELRAVLPADAAEAVWQRIDHATDLLPADDPRTADQKRADLFVDAVLSGIDGTPLPERQGRRPAINVVVALSTLLGLDNQPGDLAGYGAITAQQARELAADESATWRRFVTDPVTSELLDYGTTVYRPPQHLRDFLLARSPVCVFPGCTRSAYRCDFDHRKPFASGGPTSPANMDPLCRRHHQAKTLGHWTYTDNHDGSRTWTDTRTGHQHHAPPPERWNHGPIAGTNTTDTDTTTDTTTDTDTDTDTTATSDRAAADRPAPNRGTPDQGTPNRGAPNRGTPNPREQRYRDYLQSLPPDIPPF
jgi:hypothetical protein